MADTSDNHHDAPRRAFPQRLQRSPPMIWDLDYVPEAGEDPDELAADVCMSPADNSSCSSAASPRQVIDPYEIPDFVFENPEGFLLPFDQAMAARLGQALGKAEEMACCLLKMGKATERLLQQHFDLLPSKPHARNCYNSDLVPTSASFGAFVHVGILGCHKLTVSHPWSSMLWTALIRAVDPQHHFTSIALAKNTVSTLHSDMNNHPEVQNLVVSICTQTCTGGAIWVSDEQGSVVHAGAGRGTDLLLAASGVKFNPRSPHFTYPLTGIRLVAVAFHVRDSWRLSYEDTAKILQLGFKPRDIAPSFSDPYL